MNWKEQMMANMIQNWIMNPPKHTYRIHISHNDMDGYACHMVTDIFGRYIYSGNHYNKPVSQRKTIYHAVTEVNPDSVKATINDVVKYLVDNTNYFSSGYSLSFLITDIGSFDPDTMFADLIEKGHTVSYLVVDHHQDFRKIGERNHFKTISAFGDIYHNGWFSIPGTGACELLLKAFTPEYGFNDPLMSHSDRLSELVPITKKTDKFQTGRPEAVTRAETPINLRTLIQNLSDIIRNVSKSDVGEWDNLVDGVPGPILAQRLIWSYYTKIPNGPERWYVDTMDYLMDATGEWKKIFDQIIASEAAAMTQEYELFKSSIVFHMDELEFKDNDALWKFRHDFYKFIEFKDEAFKNMDKSCFVLLRDADGKRLYPNYSIMAKWFMKDHPNCYFMFGIDTADHELSMRSYNPEADCAKFATNFGGGGHTHAAGFKMANFSNAYDEKFGS